MDNKVWLLKMVNGKLVDFGFGENHPGCIKAYQRQGYRIKPIHLRPADLPDPTAIPKSAITFYAGHLA